MKIELEGMDEFFRRRVDDYDRHMLEEVEGCREGYQKMAELLRPGIRELLDLGCGTGLELEMIFSRCPQVQVTRIDLSEAMLRKLREKYPDRPLRTVCGSYLDRDFGEARYDAAVSFQTLHHLSHEEKTSVYRQIRRALRPDGVYVECDYMVLDQVVEDELYDLNRRLRREQGIPEGQFCHFDTPCTVENQLKMLEKAGFAARMVWRQENTTILVANPV